MKKIVFSLLLLISISCTTSPKETKAPSSKGSEQEALTGPSTIVPAPAQYLTGQGVFLLQSGMSINLLGDATELKGLADFLIKHPFTKDLNLSVQSSTSNNITLELLPTAMVDLGPEGYSLSVSPARVHIKANKAAGLFYGIQSLLHLIPLDGPAPYTLVACEIKDQPRFAWRGLMLDVSRHFFTVPEVKQYMDAMALYKFNTLHLHLTDDNGWRIEIKALPKLTSVGAWRVERHGTFGDRAPVKAGEPTPYGGYYTHEQIKELVQYGISKHITIIPEIETPGHNMALLAAYPELSCTHEKVFVNPGTNFAEWYADGTFKMLVDNTLNPANEKVYEFLDKIFTEVAMLFPNPYIHIGGDECYHGYWKVDPGVKALMAKENLKDMHEVQSYFIKRVEKILISKNKKLLGWEEILEGGLASKATIMDWRGLHAGVAAAKDGHQVVMTPKTFTYIDYMQGDRSLEFPIYASLSLKKAYSFDPLPDSIDAKNILGGQANLWSEKTPTLRHAFYMTYPRALAVAESVWSPKASKNWNSFIPRVEHHFKLFDRLKWNSSRSLYDGTASVSARDKDLLCTLTTELPDATIHYTMDNTFPDEYAPKYVEPFVVPEGDVTLRFVVVKNDQVMGRMAAIHRNDLLTRVK